MLIVFAAAAIAAITLTTPTGDLHGTEVLPESGGPHPVVLIIAGSGPTDRDGNSRALPGRNDSLKMLAEGLALKGVASVRYDKRGIAASAKAGMKEEDLRFEHYVDDAAAWIAKLKADKRFARVVVAGHSEGSLIGMLAAKKAGADAVASIAGIARPGNEVLRDQLGSKLPPELMKESDRVLSALTEGKTVVDSPPTLAALYRPSVQPYLISWFRQKPVEAIKALSVPVAIVQGTHDIQVDPAEARTLAAAKPEASLVLVEGMNHVLKMSPKDPKANVASYSDPTLPVAPAVIEAVTGLAKPRQADKRNARLVYCRPPGRADQLISDRFFWLDFCAPAAIN